MILQPRFKLKAGDLDGSNLGRRQVLDSFRLSSLSRSEHVMCSLIWT